MGVYERFETRKQFGEILDTSELTREQLKRMWANEGHSDLSIAKLFDVKKSVITNLRKSMRLTQADVSVDNFFSMIPEWALEVFKLLNKMPESKRGEIIQMIKQMVDEQRD